MAWSEEARTAGRKRLKAQREARAAEAEKQLKRHPQWRKLPVERLIEKLGRSRKWIYCNIFHLLTPPKGPSVISDERVAAALKRLEKEPELCDLSRPKLARELGFHEISLSCAPACQAIRDEWERRTGKPWLCEITKAAEERLVRKLNELVKARKDLSGSTKARVAKELGLSPEMFRRVAMRPSISEIIAPVFGPPDQWSRGDTQRRIAEQRGRRLARKLEQHPEWCFRLRIGELAVKLGLGAARTRRQTPLQRRRASRTLRWRSYALLPVREKWQQITGREFPYGDEKWPTAGVLAAEAKKEMELDPALRALSPHKRLKKLRKLAVAIRISEGAFYLEKEFAEIRAKKYATARPNGQPKEAEPAAGATASDATPPDALGEGWAPPIDIGGMRTGPDLAVRWGVDEQTLRVRLSRFRTRQNYVARCWTQFEDARQHEPRYLYDENAVKPILDALREGKRSPNVSLKKTRVGSPRK